MAICAPTDMHADLIEQAARAGKAIFCEKPVALDVERIRRCLDVVAKAGATLMIGFNRRFDPNFAALQARLAAGAIGDVEIVTVTSRDPGPPPISYIARSGGLYRDMMIHDFDMARFLLGEEPVAISAMGSSLVDKAIGEAGDVDSAVVVMETKSGKLAQISNSRRATYGYDQRIEAHGAKGMLSAGNVRETTVEFAGAAGVVGDKISTSSSSATRSPIGSNSTPSSTPSRPAASRRRTARTDSPPTGSPTPPTSPGAKSGASRSPEAGRPSARAAAQLPAASTTATTVTPSGAGTATPPPSASPPRSEPAAASGRGFRRSACRAGTRRAPRRGNSAAD